MSMEDIVFSKHVYNCEYCNSSFALKRTLNVHLKSSKKCIANRPKIELKCLWCYMKFSIKEDLEKHYSKCNSDKNLLYKEALNEIDLLKTKEKEYKTQLEKEKKEHLLQLEKEKKEITQLMTERLDKEIERLNDIIKDLSSKVNSTTINPVTYNITLNCGKPLVLDKKRIVEVMDNSCGVGYIKRGQIGLAEWFLLEACMNENSEITLECTDKKRKTFRFIDENDETKQLSGDAIVTLLRECMPSFENTFYYKQAEFEANEEHKHTYSTFYREKINEFKKPGTKFINHLVDRTHISSPNCIIPKRKQEQT